MKHHSVSSNRTPLLAMAAFCCSLSLVYSCISIPSVPPITEAQKSIKMISGDQGSSINLNETCKPIGTVVTIAVSLQNPNYYGVQDKALELGADTAQVIYTDNRGVHVRYWLCAKSAINANKPGK